MKKKIIIVLSIIVFALVLVSLYNTFAYKNNLDNSSSSDINLTYSLDYEKNMAVTVEAHDEKYVDIRLKNNYSEKVKYGVYYQVIEPDILPNEVSILIDNNSINNNEEIIRAGEEKVVTVIIKNDSDNSITVSLGNVIGFVQGDISTLLKDNMILIK